MGDLVVAAELPATVNNEIGQDLIQLEFDCTENPADVATHQKELRRIAGVIAVVI